MKIRLWTCLGTWSVAPPTDHVLDPHKAVGSRILATFGDPTPAMSSISSNRAPEPVGHYPHARRVGGLLFLSGVGPRERGTRKIPGVELDEQGNILSYDIGTQCRSVFQNVKWILEDAGSGWDRIVDVTVYLTNMRDDFPTFNRLWKEYFENDPPCRTTIGVTSLPTPIAIELKVVAMV